MDFLKKHYEKILLGIVLVGLAVAVGFLPFKIANEKDKLDQARQNFTHPQVKALPPLDLGTADTSLRRGISSAFLDLNSTNRVVNPMTWQKTKEDRLVPSIHLGPTSLLVTNITPLYLKLTLDSVTVSDSGVRYSIGIQREAAARPSDRTKKQSYASLNEQKEYFKIVEVKGKPEDPAALVLQLRDTGENVTITKEKPWTRVDGYMADMEYTPEKRKWAGQRVGASIQFNGEEYKIVAITQNEVVLSASNQKKWTIKLNARP